MAGYQHGTSCAAPAAGARAAGAAAGAAAAGRAAAFALGSGACKRRRAEFHSQAGDNM